MKNWIYRMFLLALACCLMVSFGISASAEEGGAFNASLNIVTGENEISVTVDNSEANNVVLAAQQPKLTIPCDFTEAHVMHDGAVIASELADGKISFTVRSGGEYQIISGSAPVLKFSGASLTLQHNLAINFKVDKTSFDGSGFTDPYVVFEWGGSTATVSNYTVSNDNKYVFVFSNIAPNQMNDVVSATLYATNGGTQYISETKEYSVADYCYGMLTAYPDDEYAELRTLLVDTLNYGAVSQQYTGYNTDALVNAALTDTQKAWGTSTELTLNSVLNTKYATVENPTATWNGAGLLLNEAVSVRLKFTAKNIEGLSVKIVVGNNTWTISSDSFIAQGEDVYYVYFNGLNPAQMRETFYLTICDGDTAVSNTASYSIESYAYEKQNSTISYLAELVKAMMKYGDAAYAYVN